MLPNTQTLNHNIYLCLYTGKNKDQVKQAESTITIGFAERKEERRKINQVQGAGDRENMGEVICSGDNPLTNVTNLTTYGASR